MKYVARNTSIRVPQVYIYDDDAYKIVGGAWMVMEYIPDPSLEACWPSMSSTQREVACMAIANIIHRLLSCRFPSIGSLRISHTKEHTEEFDVGPVVVPNILTDLKMISPAPEKCGPFSTVREWLLALAKGGMRFQKVEPRPMDSEISFLMRNAIKQVNDSDLLSAGPSADNLLLSIFVLQHIDLRPHNLLVSPKNPGIITAVIDWEGACITPIWDVTGVPAILDPDLILSDARFTQARMEYYRLKWQFDNQVEMCPDGVVLEGLRTRMEALEGELTKSGEELERAIWREVACLNADWQRARTEGKNIRNLAMIAKCSRMKPGDFVLEN
ncbi:hypothetical protein C8J57DRAFT_1224640 [Mycena rebaudengoi]|nr:hypothetical protein C8J57DRAFT_1224640 [Mycena rebaudengoi]